MTPAEIPVVISDLDDWDVDDEIDTGLAPFIGGGHRIEPSLTLHRDVVVIGREWLPIKSGHVALLIHTPEIYFQKVNLVQALRREKDAVVATTGPIRDLPGVSIMIGGADHLYHWLIDYLPRLLMARRVMDPLPRILLNRPGRIQIESLKLLGIHDWEEVNEAESVRCEQLWIPSLLAHATIPHPAIAGMLRHAFPPTKVLSRRDVYLSRRDAATRHLLNEDELLRALPNFETHVTAHLTLQEQVNLFASIDRLVAVHGNGLTNQVFCRQGTRVFEIAVREHQVTSMQCLAMVCGLKHQFVAAEVAVLGKNHRELLGHWRVEVEAMRRAISENA